MNSRKLAFVWMLAAGIVLTGCSQNKLTRRKAQKIIEESAKTEPRLIPDMKGITPALIDTSNAGMDITTPNCVMAMPNIMLPVMKEKGYIDAGIISVAARGRCAFQADYLTPQGLHDEDPGDDSKATIHWVRLSGPADKVDITGIVQADPKATVQAIVYLPLTISGMKLLRAGKLLGVGWLTNNPNEAVLSENCEMTRFDDGWRLSSCTRSER